VSLAGQSPSKPYKKCCYDGRCKGLHGLDVQLTLKLGKTYECHALEAAATADQDAHANSMVPILESRAATYYKERVFYMTLMT